MKVIKNSRATAEKLLMIQPNYYDAYLALGVENYLFSLKPAPVRWFLQAGGAQTDRDRGVEDLALDRREGPLFGSLRAAVAGCGCAPQQRCSPGRGILSSLSHEFPHNRLYAQELAQLN